MAASPSIIDPFHREVNKVLAEEVDKRMVHLASGGAASHEEYKYQVGYLEALNRVLAICQDIENDRYGKRPGEGEQQAAGE